MKHICTLLITSLLLLACQKELENENRQTPPVPKTSDYIINTEGSYWVYERFTVDANGIEVSENILDTIKCLGVESLSGVKYTRYYRSFQPMIDLYLKDSNASVVDNYGNVHFSLSHGNNVFSGRDVSGLLHEELNVENVDQDLSTQAGNFETVQVAAKYFYLDGSEFNTCKESKVVFNTFYTKGVGKVWIESAYITDLINTCQHTVRKLKSYHIAK